MTNEEIKQAAEVMIAAANGASIQFRKTGSEDWFDLRADNANWDWKYFDYRIKPTKTFRPWNPEEVPLGAQTRVETDPSERGMIVGVNVCGVLLGGENETYPYKHLFELRQHSTDGGKTWLPCGVEVESLSSQAQ